MKFTEAKVGQSYNVTSTLTSKKMTTFLHSLGIIEGTMMTLISKVGGNFIIIVKDSRYAIDKALASEIQVERV